MSGYVKKGRNLRQEGMGERYRLWRSDAGEKGDSFFWSEKGMR